MAQAAPESSDRDGTDTLEIVQLHSQRRPPMTEPVHSHAFTTAEANRLVPEMEKVMAEVERLRRKLEEVGEQLQILDALWGSKVLEEANPDHAELLQHRSDIDEMTKLIQDLVDNEILARGIRFPVGGLEHGLLDFPTTLDGRWVYLCWMRGEPTVEHWHEIIGGFAGRQPVTDEDSRRMGLEPLDGD